MSDNTSSFPAEVHVLKPRKVSVSRGVDDFLKQEGLATACSGASEAGRGAFQREVRPDTGNINAICCALCGEVEYLSREYCRCGHYLVGQLQDEYLAYERVLAEAHSRLSAEADRKLRPLRLATLVGLPFVVWPFIHELLYGATGSLAIWLWMLPGIAVYGLLGLIQANVNAKQNASAQALQTATFEQFLIDRLTVTNS